MKEKYDEATGDFFFFLTQEEVELLESDINHTPFFSDSSSDNYTILKQKDITRYIDVQFRRWQHKPSEVVLSTGAYENLKENRICGTRYGPLSSKVTVIIDDELAIGD